MTKIYLSADTGYSGTKATYWLEEGHQYDYFLMSSKIASVTPKKLKEYQENKGWLGCPTPERQSWLEWDEKIAIVGSLAEQFDPIDCREEPKYSTALYKVLAAIGVIVQKHGLSTRKKIRVKLAVLLPCDEYSDRERFQKILSKVSSNYKYRGQTIKVKIEEFVCRPEGGGLAMARMGLKGGEWFNRQRLGIWMLGSRNFTALYFEHGELKVSDSPLMGFSYLVNEIVEKTSRLSPQKLNEAIFLALEEERRNNGSTYDYVTRPMWSQSEGIKSLATARDLSLWQEEVNDIARVVENVGREWEEKVEKWLKKVFPPNLTEISISGGPVPFFAPLIEQYFNCSIYSEQPKRLKYGTNFVPIELGAGITPKVKAKLSLNTLNTREQALAFRLIDCFAVLDNLVDIDEEQIVESTKTA